jgi:hypothetical protein
VWSLFLTVSVTVWGLLHTLALLGRPPFPFGYLFARLDGLSVSWLPRPSWLNRGD